jgi:hypothetical protein
MKKLGIYSLFWLLASRWSQAHAGIVFRCQYRQSDCDCGFLKAEIEKQFQVPNMTDFLGRMSNAQSLSNKGQGVSYATDHSLFVVGGSGGVGFSSASGFDVQTSGGLPPVGVGVQGSGHGWYVFGKTSAVPALRAHRPQAQI